MNNTEELPPSWRITRVVSREPEAPQDATQVIGEQRLADLARPGMRVTIAFTDATRACPDERLVGDLLGELEQCGVAPDDITLICATGLHRPSTSAERLAKLGAAIVSRYRIIDHNALDPGGLIDLGNVNGIPLVVNRHCIETDLLLATGVVEPHQYAGYSGGAKTVVIGCGGEATISATHGPAMLDHPGTRLGAINGNPFQAFVRAGGERAGLRYVINTILDETGAPIVIAAGPPALVHDYLVAQARTIYEAPVAQPVHIARAGVDGPKAVNLYQASRAATYLALAENTPLLPGAPILLPAPIPEAPARALANAASSMRSRRPHRRSNCWTTCAAPVSRPAHNAPTSWRRCWCAIRSLSLVHSTRMWCAPAICTRFPTWQRGLRWRIAWRVRPSTWLPTRRSSFWTCRMPC